MSAIDYLSEDGHWQTDQYVFDKPVADEEVQQFLHAQEVKPQVTPSPGYQDPVDQDPVDQDPVHRTPVDRTPVSQDVTTKVPRRRTKRGESLPTYRR